MKFREFKEMFVDLTKITVPNGTEDEYYENYFKPITGLSLTKEDNNYFYVVGDGTDSKTLFCSHLDTASWDKKEVSHQFYKSYIFSDGKTILGADNKTGVLILLYLIYNKVPGTYFFFSGEEVGRKGSLEAVNNYKDSFSNFSRAISFDRRGYSSIISNQLGSTCCSRDFVDALSNQFKTNNVILKDDPYGIYTDSSSFTNIVSECTNISVGFMDEHTNREVQNINFAWEVALASASVDWESLPANRDITSNSLPNRHIFSI